MKNSLIVIAVIVILIIAILCIYRLVNPAEEEIPDLTTRANLIENEMGYDELIVDENFIDYIINKEDLNTLNINVNGLNIYLEDAKLIIDNKEIIENVNINREFAIYSNKVLVISFNYENFLYSGLVIYDIYEKEYTIIDKIKDMFIDDNYQFLNNGIMLNLKLVEEEKFLTDKDIKDLCKIKLNSDTIVKMSLIYLYDTHTKTFDNIEELSTINHESYLATYELCV